MNRTAKNILVYLVGMAIISPVMILLFGRVTLTDLISFSVGYWVIPAIIKMIVIKGNL